MSARLAAAILVASVAGSAFLPATAIAAEGTSTKPLTMTLGAPVPDSTVKRGGETRTMTLTVTNSSDTAQDFQAALNGEADGPSPMLNDSVVFDVAALDAPATKSRVGRQDGQWQGLFFPASGDAFGAFSVPAHEEFTWKVTFGLGAKYPTNDGDFTLTAQSLRSNVTADPARNTVVFKTDPAIKPGTIDVRLDPTAGVRLHPGERAPMSLTTRTTGPGEFPDDIDRSLVVDALPGMDFALEAEIDGKAVQMLESSPNHFELPPLAKGFNTGGDTDSLKLFLSLDEDSEVEKETWVRLHALHFMEGELFLDSLADAKVLPAQAATGSPSATPSTQPSATPSATPSASASAGSTATPAASASTTAAAGTSGGTSGSATASGSLASTGSGAGLYATVAGVLLAVGFGVAALGKRRRRATAV
ncbi:hypothetical protein ACIQ6Y_14645 [Streptomyces sp. NPDC096205]|uniref:hypothetical protein n=1 Tax=Streptomyces sp. NPDC096205 TaxID=3366081 RepID=UPI003828718D